MKLFKKLRKGFTLIELVVVIAVIAILSAVSVISYFAITEKAHNSNDKLYIDQVNTCLTSREILEKPATMHDALQIAEADGFKVENFKAESESYEFAYSMKDNRFVIMEGGVVVYPKNLTRVETGVNLWKFASSNTLPEGYSYYLLDSVSGEITAKGGIDVGENTDINSVKYLNPGSNQHVVIRTNSTSTSLTISAASDTVKHFGRVGLVKIEKVALNSYHEFGSAAYIDLCEGRVVLEKEADVKVLNLSADSNAYKQMKVAYVNALPEKVTRDDVELTADKMIIAEIQHLDEEGSLIGTTEKVYVYKNGETGFAEKTATNDNKDVSSPMGMMIIEATAGEKSVDEEQKDESKKEAMSKASEEEFWIEYASLNFDKGDGTKANPYQIEDARDLALVSKDCLNGNTFVNKYFKVTKDIDLQGKQWKAIGTKGAKFMGHFDGNNKTISNLINEAEATYNALFGYTCDAEINNLILKDVNVNSNSLSAGFIANAEGHTIITDCKVSGLIKSTTSTNMCWAGGFIANIEGNDSVTELKNLVNEAKVEGTSLGDKKAGGIIAQTHGFTTLSNCVNKGTVIAKDSYAGGLVSFVQNKELTIDATSKNEGSVDGEYAGELIGIVLNGSSINLATTEKDAIGVIGRAHEASIYSVTIKGDEYYGRFGGNDEHGEYLITKYEDSFAADTLNAEAFDNYKKLVTFKGWETQSMLNKEIFLLALQNNGYAYLDWDICLSEYNQAKDTNLTKEDFKVYSSIENNKLYKLA